MEDRYTIKEYRDLYKSYLIKKEEVLVSSSKYLTNNYQHCVSCFLGLLVYLCPAYWDQHVSDIELQNIRSFIHEITFENIPTYMNVPDLIPYIEWRLHLGK